MKCFNLVEKLVDNVSIPSCCGSEMMEQVPKEKDSKLEKHVPFIEELESGEILVRVGENENHPMNEDHYIQFIEVVLRNGEKVLRHNLNPGDAPEAIFPVKMECITEVREFCNLHGLWINKLDK